MGIPFGKACHGNRLGAAREANRRATGAALAGLSCIHWDLVPGVRRPSPGTGRDGEIEITKREKRKDWKQKGNRGTDYG